MPKNINELKKSRKSERINLSKACILISDCISSHSGKAVEVLVEEIFKRTEITLRVTNKIGDISGPFITVGNRQFLLQTVGDYASMDMMLEKNKAEGYEISTNGSAEFQVIIEGADDKGVLYGIGKFLRMLHMAKGRIEIDDALNMASAPRYPIRGHQLGYRPLNNTYDAWTTGQFDQYIRELAIFGANSIEIMPGETEEDDIQSAILSGVPTVKIPANRADAKAWPLMKYSYPEMMMKLSDIIDSYGLDVWIWYPNTGKDYTSEKGIKDELGKREEVFKSLKRIDAVFIPGGDPGEFRPDALFKWCDKVSEVLRAYHPKAKIWLSMQSFHQSDGWINEFYSNVHKDPKWLGGIVFAPWQKTQISELRKAIPKKYPIRHYPDITHNFICQYPVPNWDPAFAMTLGRECINPRPDAEKYIHNITCEHTVGSICYSDGIHDDVNKFVWSALDWDPETPVKDILRDYSRFFIGEEYEESVACGLLALEKNWEDPLISNSNIDTTFMQWRDMENNASNEVLDNYRFEMGLMRAYCDAYIKRRLIYETELEQEAVECLKKAAETGSLRAIENAKTILSQAKEKPVAQDCRKHCNMLADKLFKNIGAQLSVKKHYGLAWNRGAYMDTIDLPLNNSDWLFMQLGVIKEIEDESGRLQALSKMLNRTNPGAGGYYDNFGTSESLSRIAKGAGWEADPGFLNTPLISFMPGLLHMDASKKRELGGLPLAWISNVNTLYDTPLRMVYENLDNSSDYIIRITYLTNYFSKSKIRLVANRKYVVHESLQMQGKVTTSEHRLPSDALSYEGRLELTWTTPEGEQGPNIAELWIIRQQEKM